MGKFGWRARGVRQRCSENFHTFETLAHAVLKRSRVNNLLLAPEITRNNKATGFWARLLQDESLQACSDLERLLTGCEIIAALDDLELLGASR